MKILVLGTGPVGKEICAELICQGHKVTSVDQKFASILPGHFNHYCMDINTFFEKMMSSIRNYNLIVNALPGSISYNVIKALIPLGVNIVDISFMEEDTSELDELAKLYKTKVIYDCGIAPGLCNIILGHYAQRHDVKEYICMVGGMPNDPVGPYYHKALFSIRDLLSEYTRPARCRRDGKDVTLDPLTKMQNLASIQNLEDSDISDFCAFPSDGLRSLLDLKIPNMIECTLRHPGHLEAISLLKEGGFLDPDNVDLTAKVLSEKWRMEEGDTDFLTMYIYIEYGNKSVLYKILDKYRDGVTAMARTTAYSCVAIASALATWGFHIPHGVMSPEKFIMDTEGDEAFEWIMEYIKSKDIDIIVR